MWRNARRLVHVLLTYWAQQKRWRTSRKPILTINKKQPLTYTLLRMGKAVWNSWTWSFPGTKSVRRKQQSIREKGVKWRSRDGLIHFWLAGIWGEGRPQWTDLIAGRENLKCAANRLVVDSLIPIAWLPQKAGAAHSFIIRKQKQKKRGNSMLRWRYLELGRL